MAITRTKAAGAAVAAAAVCTLIYTACSGTPSSPDAELSRPSFSSGAPAPVFGGTASTVSAYGLGDNGEFRCNDLTKRKLWIDMEYLRATLNWELDGLPPNIVDGVDEGYIIQVWWAGHHDGNAEPGTYNPTVQEQNDYHRVYNIGRGPDIDVEIAFTYPAYFADKKLKVVVYLQPKRARLSDDPNGQCDQGRYVTPTNPPPQDPPCRGEECDDTPPCTGPECDEDPSCEGEDCDPPCEGGDCDPPCEGEDCDDDESQCPVPSEQNFSLDRPIGNPSAECSYFGDFTPDGEGAPAFYVTKCGLFYELTHDAWTQDQCSNGQDVSHSTACRCQED